MLQTLEQTRRGVARSFPTIIPPSGPRYSIYLIVTRDAPRSKGDAVVVKKKSSRNPRYLIRKAREWQSDYRKAIGSKWNRLSSEGYLGEVFIYMASEGHVFAMWGDHPGEERIGEPYFRDDPIALTRMGLPINQPTSLGGYYQESNLPPGMLGATEGLMPTDTRGVIATLAVVGGAYAGFRYSEGSSTGGRVAATFGGLMAGVVAALFIDPPFG